MGWFKRIGHSIVRRVRKVQGFFRFYGGKLRQLWTTKAQPWTKFTRRLAMVGIFVGLFASLYWGWSAMSRIRALQLDEAYIVAPVQNGEAGNGGHSIAATAGDVANNDAATNKAAANDSFVTDPVVTVQPLLSPPEEPVEWKPEVGIDALIRPVAATASAAPGWRRDAQTAHWYFEPAVELHAPGGSVVRAALPGTVTAVEPVFGGGLKVAVQHDGGLSTVYERVYDVTVAVGNTVSGHARLGRLNQSSATDGFDPSMMFTVYRDDVALDVFALLEYN